MQRRLNQLKGNLRLFIIFIWIGICCQLRCDITDTVQLDLSSITLMIVIYLGYKLGRTAGLVAGIIVSWFWILVFIFKGLEFTYLDLVFSGVYQRFGAIQLLGFSLQHGLFILFLGWTAGYLWDEFDKILAKQGMNINSLLPMHSHSIMISVSDFISNLLKKDISPLKMEFIPKSRPAKKDTKVPFFSQQSDLDSKDSAKASYFL